MIGETPPSLELIDVPEQPKKSRAINSFYIAGAPLAFVVVAVPIIAGLVAWAGAEVPDALWPGWQACIGGLIALNWRAGPRGGDSCK